MSGQRARGRGGVLVSGTGWGILCQGSGLTAARLTSCRDTITHSRDHMLLDSKLVCGSRSELYQVTSGGPTSMQSHSDRVDRPEACIYSKPTPAPEAAHYPCMWWGPEQPHMLSPSFHPSPNSPGNSGAKWPTRCLHNNDMHLKKNGCMYMYN